MEITQCPNCLREVVPEFMKYLHKTENGHELCVRVCLHPDCGYEEIIRSTPIKKIVTKKSPELSLEGGR